MVWAAVCRFALQMTLLVHFWLIVLQTTLKTKYRLCATRAWSGSECPTIAGPTTNGLAAASRFILQWYDTVLFKRAAAVCAAMSINFRIGPKYQSCHWSGFPIRFPELYYMFLVCFVFSGVYSILRGGGGGGHREVNAGFKLHIVVSVPYGLAAWDLLHDLLFSVLE